MWSQPHKCCFIKIKTLWSWNPCGEQTSPRLSESRMSNNGFVPEPRMYKEQTLKHLSYKKTYRDNFEK
jgi:hypothetical protein